MRHAGQAVAAGAHLDLDAVERRLQRLELHLAAHALGLRVGLRGYKGRPGALELLAQAADIAADLRVLALQERVLHRRLLQLAVQPPDLTLHVTPRERAETCMRSHACTMHAQIARRAARASERRHACMQESGHKNTERHPRQGPCMRS